MDSVHLVDWDKTLAGLRLMLAAASDGLDALLDGGRWVDVQVGLLVIEVAKLADDREDWFPLGKWATIQSMQAACEMQLKTLFANDQVESRRIRRTSPPVCSAGGDA